MVVEEVKCVVKMLVVLCLICGFFPLFVAADFTTPGVWRTPESSTVVTDFVNSGGTSHPQMFAKSVFIHVGNVGGNHLWLKTVKLTGVGSSGEGVTVEWSPNKEFWNKGTGGDLCDVNDVPGGCDWSVDVDSSFPGKGVLITSFTTTWDKGGGSDSFYYTFTSPYDEADAFAEGVETACSDGVDNDFDGSADCEDVDCVASCPGLSCTVLPENDLLLLGEVIRKDPPNPADDGVPDGMRPFGCRRLDPATKTLFDFSLPHYYGRTQRGEVYVRAKDNFIGSAAVNARVRFDDAYALTITPIADDGTDGTPKEYSSPSAGDIALTLEFKKGWNRVVFSVFNKLGQGYGQLALLDNPLSYYFDKRQSTYYLYEENCNDGIDEDSDTKVDMADFDCQQYCNGLTHPKLNVRLYEGDFLTELAGYSEETPAGPVPSPSAKNGADWCCGDDTSSAPYCSGTFNNVCYGLNWKLCADKEECACYDIYGSRTACTGGGVYCGPDMPIKACSAYTTAECELARPFGCRVQTPQMGIDYDQAFVTSDALNPQDMLCMKDALPAGGGQWAISTEANALWHWWLASSNANDYLLHDVLGLTQYVSNGEKWWYCAAASDPLNTPATKLTEYNELPKSNVPYQLEHINFQYWPDIDCDMIPDARPDVLVNTDGDPAACPDGSDACHTCTPNSENCFGPMGYCEYIRKYGGPDQDAAHKTSRGCQALAVPLPECGDVIPGSCADIPWLDSTKEAWVYPSVIQCTPENTEALCKNHIDDDHDGKMDCQDPKCFKGMRELGWELEDCPADMEYQCDDGANNDNDAEGADCNDPDCSTAPNCVHAETTALVAETYKHFVCYENEEKNNFAECCPIGTPCVNGPPWVYTKKNVFGTGVSWSDLLDANFFDSNKNLLSDVIRNMKPNNQELTFATTVRGDAVAEISFMMWFDTSDGLTWKWKYADGTYSPIGFPVTSYVTNGNSTLLWHKVIIPDALIDDSKVLAGLKFFGSSYISVDNILFKKKGSSYSDARYCSDRGTWIEDLDNVTDGEGACNSQNPQGGTVNGFGGIGWTGTMCCGDDSSGNMLENADFEEYPLGYTIEGGPQPFGWSKNSGTSLARVESEGTKAVHVIGSGRGQGIYSLFNQFESKRYVFSARVKIVSGSVEIGKGIANCYHRFDKPEGEPQYIDISVEFNNAECGPAQYLAYIYTASAGEFYVDDVDLRSLPETYADVTRGCFNANVINDNRVVGDLFGTDRSLGGNKDEYRNLLFKSGSFLVCDPNATRPYAGVQSLGGPVAGVLVPDANNMPICKIEGSYFCSNEGVWKDLSHESDVFWWDDLKQRCKEESLSVVNEVYDPFAAFVAECNAQSCYCPTKTYLVNGYQLCNDMNGTVDLVPGIPEEGYLDRQSCAGSGFWYDGWFCNGGNWTTRTALVAGYLYDYLQQEGISDYVLSCNIPSLALYEQYLGDAVGHLTDADIADYFSSACVLEVKDAAWQTSEVIIGFALEKEKSPVDFGRALDETFSSSSDKGTRLSINYNWVRDWGNDLPWSSRCSFEANNPCINAEDGRFKVYTFPTNNLMFVSTADLYLDRYPGPAGNPTYFQKLEAMYAGFFKTLRLWAVPKIHEGSGVNDGPEMLTSRTDRLYAAENAAGKRIVVTVESAKSPTGPVAYMTGRFKGFDPAVIEAQVMPRYCQGDPRCSDKFGVVDGEFFFYNMPFNGPEDVAFYYNVRLDDLQ